MSNYYYKTAEEFTSQSYIKDLSVSINLKKDIGELIRTYTSRQIRHKSKIIRNFILYNINNWLFRINESKTKTVNSRDRFIILYGEDVGTKLYDLSNVKRKSKTKQRFFISIDHFLSQKPFRDYKKNLTDNSLHQIEKIIEKYEKNYLLNIRKEMVVNLIRYNVDGDWIDRLEKNKHKKSSCSLNECISRYGPIVGNKCYNNHVEKVKCKRENYTDDEWAELCNKKRSNLGINGYIEKYGEIEGQKRWNDYLLKWKLGIENRKKRGKWKNGRSLTEYQLKYGVKLGFEKWKSAIDKRKYTLSLAGFIERFGEAAGQSKYCEFIDKMISNFRGSGSCSKISQILFNDIYTKLDSDQKNETKYFTLNNEQIFYANGKNGLNFLYVDFKCGNIIIEFDGDYWHSTPEVIEKDKRKTLFLENSGYRVLRIKESDYNNNREKITEKCLQFISENYERPQPKID